MKIYLITLLLLCQSLVGPVGAEDQKLHHQLAWIGFLNLPTLKKVPSNVMEVQRPLIFDGWELTSEQPLRWLPKASIREMGPVQKYFVKFSEDKSTQGHVSRREARRRP